MERKKFKKRFKMNTRSILSFIMLFALCLSAVWNISCADCRAQEKIMDESHKSIKVKPSDLYARSAVLMDAETGRILFGKEEDVRRANASTTKIMTLIVTLEHADLNNVVTFSDYAASQPDVQLNGASGEQFLLKDLCFSLMLESHNDSAVAIAEHVAGSVEAFAGLMNKKAAELGCMDTYFITPNGLDKEDENGFHGTTAADLARIKAETLPIPTGIQTALAEHYQALLHTNDFYQYLTLFKELGQKQTQQQSRGRKINAMDTYFYQMVERVLREELAVAFGESQQEAGRRLLEVLR